MYTEDEDARSSSAIIRGGVGFDIPEIRNAVTSSTNRKEEILLEIEVSEVHGYPLRPESFEEPLFSTTASKRAIAEHLLKASWLSSA